MTKEVVLKELIRKELEREFNSIPPREELEKMYTFSERHNQRMKEIFAEEKRRKSFDGYFDAVRKVAVIALVTVGVLMASVHLIPTVYAYVESWIVERGEDYIDFKGNGADADVAENANVKVEFGYVPDGYELESETNNGGRSCVIRYKNNEGSVLKLICYNNIDNVQLSLNTDDVLVEELGSDGITYYVFNDTKGNINVVWKEQECILNLYGLLEKSEMLKIASSVRVVADK